MIDFTIYHTDITNTQAFLVDNNIECFSDKNFNWSVPVLKNRNEHHI